MDTIEKALQKRAQNSAENDQLLQQKKTTELLDSLADQETVQEQNIYADSLTDYSSAQEKTPRRKSKAITIDLKKLENLGYISPLGTKTPINEEYRHIKRPLLNNIRGKSAHPIENANVILVTSSLQGEGKTFIAINLAIALAMEMDYNGLLVDADVIKSSITQILMNCQVKRGLTDYLSGSVNDLSDVLLTTNIEKLNILPAGTRHKLSSELLNSQHMDNLLAEFAKRYKNRIVIIDSSPILQTNESKILANTAGQIVFVVEQNKTEQSDVRNALDLIDKDAVVGLVMNKSRTGKNGGYYGYYGYYGEPEK